MEEYNDGKGRRFLCRCSDHVALLCGHPSFRLLFRLCSSAKQGSRPGLRQRIHETVQRRASGRSIWCASETKQRVTMSTKEPRKSFRKMCCIGEQGCALVR